MSRAITAARSLTFPVAVGAIIFTAAGTWNLPFVWGVLGVLAFFTLVNTVSADPDLLRERHSPGPGNQDHLTQGLTFVLMTAHWILAGLDIGRFHWSPVARELQIVGLAGYALSVAAIFYTMHVNRFYSSAVRVQLDRGHEVITTGPYRIVRHPGYAASLLAFVCGGIAIGSWTGVIPLAPVIPLFVRRLLLEDAMLKAQLPGYVEYAQRVRYRLIPGVF